jgi:hypothetical protein
MKVEACIVWRSRQTPQTHNDALVNRLSIYLLHNQHRPAIDQPTHAASLPNMPQAKRTLTQPIQTFLRARTRQGVPPTTYFAGLAPFRSHSSQSSSSTPASWVYGVPAANAGGPSTATTSVIPNRPFEATRSTPDNLPAEQRRLLEETIRVDHIGEAAANWIYQATKFVAEVKGDKNTAKQVEVSLRHL